MSGGRAANILRKNILWSMVKELKRDTCYRCGSKIENSKELSIEHKIAWINSNRPKELFFDLGNIAFSHHSCNCSAQGLEHVVKKSKSGFRGVHHHPRSSVRDKPWRAVWAPSKKKPVYFGYFKTPKEAAQAYDEGVSKILGARSVTNKKLGLL